MLGVAARNTSNMARTKVSQTRSSAPRGGIRKRTAAARTDRDGDLDMAGHDRGRGGKRGRGRGGQPQARDGLRSNLNQDRIMKAVEGGDASTQATFRQAGNRPQLQEISITGWKSSKAASNADGGVRSTVDWLERKIPSTKPGRKSIIKVCATSALAVTSAVSVRRPRFRSALLFS
jgi:nuclear RNA export factor